MTDYDELTDAEHLEYILAMILSAQGGSVTIPRETKDLDLSNCQIRMDLYDDGSYHISLEELD